ncbi:hypothetical protein GCM10010435_76620 [Winogradskya consettensis]|uniref:YncI copper-binding domain-containing protein n=1 Tax=Winogradskya consettensis TaxID=113560 RepID=A0A919VT70_9ACTN|nr:DUF1775 domain-containing protein [Actinoplanes consettensis]GIM74545.1 hypothetical protein Aco04nite_40830 [Actinoplanes consettensis]
MRNRSRLSAVAVLAGLGVLALAAPAAAHVEVTADKDTAGATDVTLTFSGEAENPSAGIKSERVVLPAGIAPADVTLVKAPAGWTFAANADGFTVGGKALKAGTDAEWKVKIAKLPDGETRLSFKTLETYGDGEVARWIEIQQEGEDEPDSPAPLVTLKPGPKPTATVSSAPAAEPSASEAPSAAPSVAPSSAPAAVTDPVASNDDDGGMSTWWIWLVLAAILAGLGFFLGLRRKKSTGPA